MVNISRVKEPRQTPRMRRDSSLRNRTYLRRVCISRARVFPGPRVSCLRAHVRRRRHGPCLQWLIHLILPRHTHYTASSVRVLTHDHARICALERRLYWVFAKFAAFHLRFNVSRIFLSDGKFNTNTIKYYIIFRRNFSSNIKFELNKK